jgi:DNA-binding transcriptional LysR family regulator
MNTEDLKTFVAVARAGSFAAVARQEGVDPSLVSRTIGALEDELGFRLFQRTTRQLSLTEAGHSYLERVAPLVEEIDLARETGQALVREPQGSLRVTASVAFGYTCIVPLLKAFRARYPRLAVELVLTDAVVDLVAERIDIAIRLSGRVDTGFVGAQLMPTRYRVVASPDYVKREGKLAHPNDLADRDCVVFPMAGYRTRWHFRSATETAKTNRNTRTPKKTRAETTSTEAPFDVSVRGSTVISNGLAILRATVDGLGPSLLPDWLTSEEIKRGNLLDLFPRYEVSASDFQTAAWILYPSRAYLPTKVRVFVDFVREHFKAR